MANARKKTKTTGRRLTGVWALVLALFMVELLFYTWCRVQCVQVGISISAERNRQQELGDRQNSLKIELARLKAPERISYIARKKMGLIMPDSRQTIMVP